MSLFSLISDFRSYCSEKGYCCLIGDDAYVNAINDSTVYENNQIIIILDLKFSPKLENNIVNEIVYSGTIAVGRKRESITDDETTTETVSSLDETFEQKFDRRLSDLSELLVVILSDFACENEININSIDARYDINKFDLNADFVAAQISLTV